MARKHGSTRREFLKTGGAVAATTLAIPYVITSKALGDEETAPASDRIVMGGIGIGSMGSGDRNTFMVRGDVQYVAACDVRKNICEHTKGVINNVYGNTDCQVYNEFWELLGREDIDAVHIATPDHWHAIIAVTALRLGKDVYCQKPETLTLREGQILVDTARRYHRVFSGGSQRVLEDYRDTVDPCWSGELGQIKSINVNVGPLSQPCNLPAEPVPDDLDWNLWLGPAPWAPYNALRCSGDTATTGGSWRSYIDYSGGGMTDWGAHFFGGALFAVDIRELQPDSVTYHEEADGLQHLSFHYPNGMLVTHNKPSRGNLQVESDPNQPKESKPVPGYRGEGGIHGDFLHCVKTREKPFRDVQLAVNTVTVCHLAIVAHTLRRSLQWNAAAQQFVDDEEANRYLDRARREPWQL